MKIGFIGSKYSLQIDQLVSIKGALNKHDPSEIHQGSGYGAEFDFYHFALRKTKNITVYQINGSQLINDYSDAKSLSVASREEQNESIIKNSDLVIIPLTGDAITDRQLIIVSKHARILGKKTLLIEKFGKALLQQEICELKTK